MNKILEAVNFFSVKPFFNDSNDNTKWCYRLKFIIYFFTSVCSNGLLFSNSLPTILVFFFNKTFLMSGTICSFTFQINLPQELSDITDGSARVESHGLRGARGYRK